MVGLGSHTWRVDAGGELHAFDRDRLWSACWLMCASLTAEVGEDPRARSACPRCAARRSGPGAPFVPFGAPDRRADEEPGLQGVLDDHAA